MRNLHLVLLASAASLALSACGGGGSGVASIPTPPVQPTPTPTPTPPPPPPPVPAGAIGLVSSAPFKTVSATQGRTVATDAVQFSYSAADNRYTIALPGFQSGQLVTTGANGSYNSSGWINLFSTVNDVTVGSTSARQSVRVILDWPAASSLRYTSSGRWFDGNNPVGVFAYGIPTTAGDVPVTGQATYGGTISGLTSDTPYTQDVFGTVSLSFDFAAGTLSGVMKPEIAPWWDAVSLGDYVFRDTVYSPGSTSFSGAFQVNGSTAPSSFQGSFTGPQAAELMASWNAPYLDPTTNQWSTMSGVWIAKKP